MKRWHKWLIGGASIVLGGGILYWLFGGRMKLGMTVWILKDQEGRRLPEDWPDRLADLGFDFVSFKVTDGTRRFDVGARVELARGAGLDVHGWGFQYCDTLWKAEAEAIQAAAACKDYGILDYHWDAEYHWLNEAMPNPKATAFRFAEVFHRECPDRRLWANCVHTEIDADWFKPGRFFAWEPQLYNVGRKSTERKWDRRVPKSPEGVPVSAMVPTGSYWHSRRTGRQVWGFTYPLGDGPGLVDLVAKYKPEALNFYRLDEMLWEGNDTNPELAETVQMVREAASV